MSDSKIIYIDNNQNLAKAAEHWLTLDRIALDSEFMRVDTFYPKLALIQINDGSNLYLIDPLNISDWQGLKDVFSNQAILKILHSPSEDIDVFFYALGVVPSPMFDTQLAASIASLGGIMSYQKLVKLLLDVDLDKGETRSDWLKRPLTDSQLHYAAEDVNYLLDMTDTLTEKLNTLGRLEWLSDDCAQVLIDWQASQAKGYSLERLKKAWMLKHHQLNVLNQLIIWRESRCKEVNIPRGHLIKDDILMELATRLPQSIEQLSTFKGLRHNTLRKEGKSIIDLIQSCKDMDQALWPERMNRPLSQTASDWLKKMRVTVNSVAEQLNVPPELLARKKNLEFLLRQGFPNGPFDLPLSLKGWRTTIIGEPLVATLKKLSGK